MKEQQIEWIPIAQVHTEIPLSPGRQELPLIVDNIREAGLKKPITVVRRRKPDEDWKQFDLVCGYYRIQAFIALGQTTIPAIILEASPVEIAQDACEGSADERTTR